MDPGSIITLVFSGFAALFGAGAFSKALVASRSMGIIEGHTKDWVERLDGHSGEIKESVAVQARLAIELRVVKDNLESLKAESKKAHERLAVQISELSKAQIENCRECMVKVISEKNNARGPE